MKLDLSVDENAVVDWLVTAKPGETLTYHVGNLAYFRREFQELNKAANRLWDAYERGMISLVQKRVEPDVMEYRAVRSPSKYRMPAAA